MELGAAAKGSTDTMAKNGLKVVEPSPAIRAEFERVGHKLIVEWTKRAGTDGEAIVKAMQ